MYDFAKRTLKNLEILEKSSEEDGSEFYEFTNLMNSLYGLIIVPHGLTDTRNHDKDRKFKLRNIPIENLRNKGWNIPEFCVGEKKINNLPKYITKLRNGLTHFHIQILANEQYKIEGIIIWDLNGKGVCVWKAKYSIEQLKSTVYNFAKSLRGLTEIA